MDSIATNPCRAGDAHPYLKMLLRDARIDRICEVSPIEIAARRDEKTRQRELTGF